MTDQTEFSELNASPQGASLRTLFDARNACAGLSLDTYVFAVFCGALYYFTAQLQPGFMGHSFAVALIRPSMGVAVAAIWHMGGLAVPFLLLAEVAVQLSQYSMTASCVMAVGSIMGVWLGVSWYRQLRHDVPYFREPRNTVMFMLLTALLPAVIAATVGAVTMKLAGVIPATAAGHTWFLWFLGDVTGSVVLASCLLVWTARDDESPVCLQASGIWLLLLLGAAAFLAFGIPGAVWRGAGATTQKALSFVLVPLLAWAAYAMSHREIVTTVFLGSVYGVWATSGGNGPFGSLGYPDSLIVLQVFIVVLTSTAFIIHATASSHRHAVQSLQLTQDAAIFSLASLAETRDPETGSHILRTREYVRLLAIQLRQHVRFRDALTPRRIELLYKSAPLHDIGKVGVADAILCKPGSVTPEEFEEIKKHTVYGRDALTNATELLGLNSFLTVAEEVILTHHERWDGTGYPRGLRGEDIPVSGRLMALADVYDALISERCYKPSMPHEKAREIIMQGRGTHFDPAVVDAFLRCEREFATVAAQYCERPAV